MSLRGRPRLPSTGVFLLAAVLLAAACSRARGQALGDLRFFPGATVVGTAAFVGEAYGFPRAAWEQVELRSEARYEQVRDFYQRLQIGGWTGTFESETRKSDGRRYTRYLVDSRRQRFYVVVVEERQRAHDVAILLRRGRGQGRP
ncbi:MAG: hypothetical protein QN203_09140 [Armatimonadota bacterium]|nr:hypothetical protein [Armatimonadota bacterium]MDR7484965.1 hypothetical protein [Armatimonadota bacterium]